MQFVLIGTLNKRKNIDMNFSVLLSLYFREKTEHLNECLQSIHTQSLKPNEVVIVFDGPVGQNLRDIVTHWSRFLPIKLLKIKENVGLGQALNKGLEVCSHEIVLRMDTDDVCSANRFKLQIDKLENDKELIVLGGHIDEYDEGLSTFIGKRIVPLDNEAIKKQVVIKNPFNHMTVAFRKSAVLAVGGYQHHAFMEDYNLWLRIIAAGYKVENLDTVLVKARTGHSMLLRRKGIEYVKSEMLLFKLKRKLQIQPVHLCFITFLVRSIPRLFPSSLLRICYKLQRK